jgi:hypothetical protein
MDPMTPPAPRRRPRGDQVISVSSDGPSEPPYEEFSLEERPPSPPPTESSGGGEGNGNGPGGPLSCPSCGAVNPANNRHCQECGARLRQGPLPTAPRPAVQATAGVRAAMAISGLLLGVIVIALFFNIFSGDDEPADTTTTTATTVPEVAENAPIDILSATCDPTGIGSFVCANLTSGIIGQRNEYQVNWLEAREEGVTITLTFLVPMTVSEIHWVNIEDPTRFQQNYRARSLTIRADDSLQDVPVSLQDQAGLQVVRFSAINTTTLIIRVIDAYQASVVADNVFDELAIDEIIVVGRPVSPATTPTDPEDDTTTTTEG